MEREGSSSRKPSATTQPMRNGTTRECVELLAGEVDTKPDRVGVCDRWVNVGGVIRYSMSHSERLLRFGAAHGLGPCVRL